MADGIIIAIDPDNNKSGVATIDVISRRICVSTLKFFDVVNYISEQKKMAQNERKCVKVIIEGGWLKHSNWHLPRFGVSPQKAAAIGRSTGMNHQTGLLLAEYCEHIGVSYEVVKPLRKIWRGRDGKITAAELKAVTGYDGRTNQDARDAVLLAWVAAQKEKRK